MNILITGVNGFIGQRLVEKLVQNHSVTGMGRSPLGGDESFTFIQGSFHETEDLHQLDGIPIDVVVHLAAVTGGSDEESALAVNVQGTRRLYRYLLDRGCSRFITASSIAATGSLHDDFMPLELPIPEDHPCLAKDAYGLSKAMVEDLTRYFHRMSPGADFINLRLGAVATDGKWTAPVMDDPPSLSVPFIQFGHVYVSDVVDGLIKIINAPPKDRVITCNFVGPDVSASVPSLSLLRSLLGDQAAVYDLSHFDDAKNHYKPLYRMDRLVEEFGFMPKKSFRST
ncbi:NAD-dependent epimerase/dehydratase family protein [Paenibacillus sp. FJAT-27812]|uniref:NAD-dependent epimerase/dehydratase family protein n=1 Tax=Paenibacillus sp. FJAT-27812 TaxID=1684143 RepID=UPI0006A763E4|nr:NAD(P)-dependent oxidoreductase [Paenibacillus sp. FJAT-27812]